MRILTVFLQPHHHSMTHKTDIATRSFIIGLKSASCGKTTAEVSAITGVPGRTIQAIFARAIKRGFDPNIKPVVARDKYVIDAPRSGRPTKQMKQTKQTKQAKQTIDSTIKETQQRRLGYLSTDSIAYPQEDEFQEDNANSQVWIDEEDESGASSMVS
ncbi:hypothetical protein BDY21DRAFT_28137 [Lineolata rhizophorae]|uniref:Uncharacterized protein n=1 Tax=Lineolata rhizophorae TaxID=578093 RepID=A0A6A6P1A3_9PEZI|nr:hypothetical protein BDY21DRAFT_28137 [Lineolata rhizophorae]